MLKISYHSVRLLGALLTGAAALLAASCGRQQIPEPVGDVSEVRFVLGGGTRATGVTAADEEGVDHWAVFLFRDGERVAYSTSMSSAPISMTVGTGTYTVCAVVNYPASFPLSTMTDYDSLMGYEVLLSENGLGALEMFGEVSGLSVTAAGGTEVIPVKRLVCRLGVKKVTVNMARPSDAAKTFVLKGMYVSNAYSRSELGGDLAESRLNANRSYWYNPLGVWGASGNVVRLLADRDIDTTIPNGSSYGTAHYFYAFPNATVSDTHSLTWSKRHTRIVLEASLGGTTYYYQVNLPQTCRNGSYIVDNATITKPGSLDPEDEVDGAVDVVFSVSPDGWDGPVDVTEES